MLYDPTSFQESESEHDEEVVAPTEEELEDFRQQVQEWLKLDDSIRKLSIAMRERKVHQRALACRIQDFMIKFNYDNLNTQMGRIRSNVRQVRQPLRLNDIREKIIALHHLSGEDLVTKIFEEDRPVVEKKSLRRIIPKVSLSLEI